MPHSILKSLGRGYSDVCASLCAVGLSAQDCSIWKEVDGIFTADPHQVPSARLLATVTPEEAAELTHYGSEVGFFRWQQSKPVIQVPQDPRGMELTFIYCRSYTRWQSTA